MARTLPDLPRRRLVGAALSGAAVAAGWRPAPLAAQAAYPSHPVTVVVPFAPGGIADLTARAVTRALGESLGQPFVIDNRPGAGATVAGTMVAHAKPDGHTLLLMSNGNAVSASLFRKLPFDIVRDFSPVSTLAFFDLGVMVAGDSRFASLRDLLAWARANPGKLNIGCIAIGSTQHLAAELFKTRAGIDALIVPYKGTPAVVTALRAGEVDLAFEILGPMLPQVTSRALRCLAVTSADRHPALPEVATVQQVGVAGYDVSSWNALAAPAGTPPGIIDQLNRATRDALAEPTVTATLKSLGVRARAGTPAQLQALLTADIKRWGDVITTARIEPQ